jgi:hypothetical protein
MHAERQAALQKISLDQRKLLSMHLCRRPSQRKNLFQETKGFLTKQGITRGEMA